MTSSTNGTVGGSPRSYRAWLLSAIGVIAVVLVIYYAVTSSMGRNLSSADANAAKGSTIYQNRCASCHQDDGQGIAGAYPPLALSERVAGDRSTLISIVLHGMQGPITVHGVKYNGVMPSTMDVLSDDEVAAVLNYVRGSWGVRPTDKGTVDASMVEDVRKRTAHRVTPWTETELEGH
ncbi:MAG TPA: cytochrome c [Candidatus Kapabacteria bacterium]|nr:cytochrome c [Candidatus Kapabacteria bacterium]